MSDGILLKGLDGSNPLAFLAALGTFRTLTLALPNEKVEMAWEQHDGAWRPRVHCSIAGDGDALIATLDRELRKASDRAVFSIGDNLNLPAGAFRGHLRTAIERAERLSDLAARLEVDFLAAFGSEIITNDDGIMTDTALRTMSGAGHQHFLKFFRELTSRTDADHLRRTLVARWDYMDEGRGMNLRWDPVDDRRYALRWNDPSADPVMTMRGANRLAIEALPFFSTMPAARALATTAFEGSGARDTCFIWPIWATPVTESVARSLLGQVRWLRDHPMERSAVGVAAMFWSARITTGKFRNFTPGQPVS